MILVTGATGFLGSELALQLAKQGNRFRCTRRASSSIPSILLPFATQIEWVNADMLDVFALGDALKGVTQVYHCAAMVSFEKKKEAEMMKINIEGTANMVNAALEKNVSKFCHVSSIAAIGRAEKDELTTEENFWKSSPDNSNYSISKYGAEREVWRAAEEGLNVVIVNPSLIIGGGNWTQSSANMFSKGYKGIKFYSSGINGFVDVRDVSAIMIKLMESDISNQRFLLNSENASFKKYFEIMHEAFGKAKPSIKAGKFLTNFAWRAEKVRASLTGTVPLITKETAQSANKISRFSNEKIKNIFPDYKFISMEQSIKDTCRLYLKDLGK
ncbi:MAG: NAD-dependent epimerase/dehydratase family protein [Bacteroidia bacterium]